MDSETNAASSGPRACKACAGSKAKCTFLPESTIPGMNRKCKRCNRLNKECIMQTPALRKPRPRKTTRVDQLEEKLANLTSMLKNPDETNGSSIATPQSTDQSFNLKRHATPSSSASGKSPSKDLGVISHDEDAIRPGQLLFFYRSYMFDQFPFVIIPPGTKADELKQQKPFLYKTILMAASFQYKPFQDKMSEEIWEYLCTHMIIKAEKSLDLLQGLLVLMAWYHSHIHLARRMTLMIQLANTLVIDLGLNPKSAIRSAHNLAESGNKAYPQDEAPMKQPTLEECRAFLGLKYMTSVISTYVKYQDDLSCASGYVEKCLQFLQDSDEYPSDALLIQLVRLQNIAQEINEALPRYEDDFSSGASAPISMCIRTLQSKLESFRTKLPLHLQQNPFLLMHYHSMLAYLTETALAIPLSSRHATLQACLTSTQAFLSFMFCVPLVDYYKFTYVSWSQLMHILVVLYKLSNFASPDWDLAHVRGVMDLSQILDNIISRFQQLMAWSKGDGLLTAVVPRLQEYRQAFERKRASLAGSPATSSSSTELELEPLPQMELDDLMFGQLDEGFWQEIMSDWNPVSGQQFASQQVPLATTMLPPYQQQQYMFGYPLE